MMVQVLNGASPESTNWVCFLNAHNFNRAQSNPNCAKIFETAIAVFPDGIALRAGARLHGIHIHNNLPGTDLIPALMSVTKNSGRRCFLLGNTEKNVKRAGHEVEKMFPGWKVVGVAPGYFGESEEEALVDQINESEADLLLLGMGTPLQEHFIQRNRHRLRVPLLLCAGGLFSYWAGTLRRAPRWARVLNTEWVWIVCQQPHKFSRYCFGTARFFRVVIQDLISNKFRSSNS